MKKILIFSHGLDIGGAETALLGLLETIDTTRCEVDLFLMRHDGTLMKYIPDKINLLSEIPQYASLAVPITEVLKHGQIKIAYGRFIGKRKAIRRVQELGFTGENGVGLEYSHKYTCKFMPNITDKEYDLAISFLTPHYFVAEKVKAKKKIAWIHTDYGVVKVDTASELQMWDRYDSVISISEQVTQTFLSVFPLLEAKIKMIENILPKNYVEELCKAFSVEQEMRNDGSLKLLTIGRFSPPKKLEEVPKICEGLRDCGLNVKWYIIGFGGEEPFIRSKITEAGMEEYVIILGKKENPYPYIKACDLYAQLSRYEGKSVAVREAQMLGKPVVITNYATAHSQLEDGVDGVIVPMDMEGSVEEIAKLLQDPAKMHMLSENCKNRDYSNSAEIEKLYLMLEE